MNSNIESFNPKLLSYDSSIKAYNINGVSGSYKSFGKWGTCQLVEYDNKRYYQILITANQRGFSEKIPVSWVTNPLNLKLIGDGEYEDNFYMVFLESDPYNGVSGDISGGDEVVVSIPPSQNPMVNDVLNVFFYGNVGGKLLFTPPISEGRKRQKVVMRR